MKHVKEESCYLFPRVSEHIYKYILRKTYPSTLLSMYLAVDTIWFCHVLTFKKTFRLNEYFK